MISKIKNKLIIALSIVMLVAITLFGLSFSAKSNVTYAANTFTPSGNICIEDGASIRADKEESSGLKFVVYLNKTYFDGITGATAGATIVPKSYIDQTVESKGSYTFANLTSYVNDADLPLAYKDITTLSSYNQDYYKYSITLSKVLDANYTKDFVCIAYVRTASETADFENVSGTDKITNGYYNTVNNSNDPRSVYEVAYNAINSDQNLGEAQATVKSFVDGVAVLSNSGTTVSVANNTAKYTSPFSVAKSGNQSFVSGVAKGVIYNGEVKTFPVKDTANGLEIHNAKTQQATIGSSITLKGTDIVGNANPATLASVKNSIGYYGLNGKYGIGTFIDISFTGNNMPYITFFADTIDGDITNQGGGKGVMIVNGIVTTDGANYQNYNNQCNIFGNDRIKGTSNENMLCWSKTWYDGGEGVVYGLEKFAQSEMQDGVNYRLIVGTSDKSGMIYITMNLYNVTDMTVVNELTFSSRLESSAVTAGNIVFHAAMRGDKVDSVFNINAITDGMDYAGEDIQRSYTLHGSNPGNIGASNYTSKNADWITGMQAFVGKGDGYGLGTYVDVRFTGNNMPQLSFFASNTTGGIHEGKGILLLNGITHCNNNWAATAPNTTWGTEGIQVFGPNMFENQNTNKYYAGSGNLAKLGQDYLKQNATTEFRLIMGAIEKSGTIYLDIQFIDVTNSNVLAEQEISVGITVEEMKTALGLDATDELKGFIQAHGTYKGREDGTLNTLSTTFSIAFSNTRVEPAF